MIRSVLWANIMTIQNHLPFQFAPVLLDVIVLDHDNDHIHFIQELVKVKNLVRHNGLVGEEGIETL